MKKLPSQPQDMFRKLNELIDLVNSQQEAIEKLQEHVDHEARHVSEPADDKPEYPWTDKSKARVARYEQNLAEADTHRTVTLRIPKGMRIGEAIRQVWMEAANSGYLGSVSDTDLQKALDEVQPNE